MNTICLEMPVVSKCEVNGCVYNANSGCHARAISIGDAIHPGYDTFMTGPNHAMNTNQIAGIGACKTAGCKFNDDLECMAENVQVGMLGNEVNCMTFTLR